VITRSIQAPMSLRNFLCRLAAWFFALATSALPAQPAAPLAEPWQLRTVHFPAGFWWGQWSPCFGSPDKMANVLPKEPLPLPARDAPAREWEQHIRLSTIYIAAFLAREGIITPEGALYLYDGSTGTLAVRSTSSVIDQIEATASEYGNRSPMTVAATLEIVEAEASIIRQALSKTSGKSDHTAVWRALRKLTEEGRATLRESLSLETRSGQRAWTQGGSERWYTTGVKCDPGGRIESVRSDRNVGTTFTLEPVILPSLNNVDAAITVEHHLAPPVQRQEPAGRAGSRGEAHLDMTDFNLVRIHSDFTWASGAKRLVGVWTSQTSARSERGEVMQAAFVGVKVVPLVMQVNKDLAGLLERHGAKLPPPTGIPRQAVSPPAADLAAAGFVTRTFKVPGDFLMRFYSIGQSENGSSPKAGDDPFAGPNPSGIAPRREVTIADVLARHGIGSPEGSALSFIPSTSTLVARNTVENLDKLGEFIERIWDEEPKILSHTLYIVEGDGATLRRMSDEDRRAKDAAAWKQAETLMNDGTLTLRNTVRLDGCKQPVFFEYGTVRMSAPNLADLLPGKELQFPTQVIGTRFKSDTMLGFKPATVDLEVALEHHFAPPSQHGVHVGKVAREEKLPRGITKLVGLWKKEGTKELEGKDVMQAAFLRVDVIIVGKE
jgi:hypothetical protein